jgi:hypothetical protein
MTSMTSTTVQTPAPVATVTALKAGGAKMTAATSKPAPTVAQLEASVIKSIATAEKSVASLPATLVKLYQAKAWESHQLAMVDYFRDTLGISEDSGYTLPFKVRRELVTLMARECPQAEVAHVVIMSGSSVRSIQRDRSELGVANPNRVNAQTSGSDDTGDGDGDDKPAKAPRKSKGIDDLLANMTQAELMAVMAKITTMLMAFNAGDDSDTDA